MPKKRTRRIVSHHGSDCPQGPHKVREARCIILTRIDRPGKRSEIWVSGDWAEGRVSKRYRQTIAEHKPAVYGGGFWERVELPPLEQPIVPPLTPLRTSINGTPAEWDREIWEKWYTHVERADPKLYDSHGLPSDANYFTPRPYVDEYNRGDTKEGFTITINFKVYQIVINGQGIAWLVSEPCRRPR